MYLYRINRGNCGTTDKRVILHEKNKLKRRILYEALFSDNMLIIYEVKFHCVQISYLCNLDYSIQ